MILKNNPILSFQLKTQILTTKNCTVAHITIFFGIGNPLILAGKQKKKKKCSYNISFVGMRLLFVIAVAEVSFPRL